MTGTRYCTLMIPTPPASTKRPRAMAKRLPTFGKKIPPCPPPKKSDKRSFNDTSTVQPKALSPLSSSTKGLWIGSNKFGRRHEH